MKQAKVAITRQLVEEALTTDGDTRKLLTKVGLPRGARLVGARLQDAAAMLVLTFEHDSFAEADEPAEITPEVAVAPPPNRYLYHVAGLGSFGNVALQLSDSVLMPGPITHPGQIKEIEAALASKVQARGPNGATMVGVKAAFVVINFILLRAWYEEAQPQTGDPAAAPDGQRSFLVHLVEDALTTAGDTRKLFTQAGLPAGARLVSARLVDNGAELELIFEHESFEDLDQPPKLLVRKLLVRVSAEERERKP